MLPLNFQAERKNLKSNNLEILKYIEDNSDERFGAEFLKQMCKIDKNLKINNIEVGKFVEFSEKKSRINKKKIIQSNVIEEFSPFEKPEQKILEINPYKSITKNINFYKIDKKVHKLIRLIEIANEFLKKGKIVEEDSEILKMINSVNKNLEELITFKKLCIYSEEDLLNREKIYQRYNLNS